MSEMTLDELQRHSDAMFALVDAAERKKRETILEGQNCFVCYLDLDGFKHRVMEQPEQIYASYQRQRESLLSTFFHVEAFGSAGSDDVQLRHLDKLLWPYMFSDSWFFASIDSTPESLRQISAAAAGIMMRCWEIGFPARGGIGGGALWWNPKDQIILGPAIVNAYSVAELLDCFGVSIHPELSNRAEDGAFTSLIRTPIKRSSWNDYFVRPYKQLRFACLNSDKTTGTWMTDGWLKQYDELEKEYEARSGAKRHIVRRYQESRIILEEMLLREPDRS